MLARPDGTMVTRDCKSRLRSLRAKGVVGWLAFFILIVPVALGTHLVQAAWLWGACQTLGKVSAPLSRPFSNALSRPIMGAMLMPTISEVPEAERPSRQ